MIEDGLYDIPPGKVAAVMTHLEMLTPAPERPVPAPKGVTFEQIKPDLDRYRDLFKRVGSFDWLWHGRLKMKEADLNAILNDPKVAFYTLSKNGKDEALLELDFRQDGACELAYFGLTANLIGSGAGRFLMNKAISLAWAQDISRFHVHNLYNGQPTSPAVLYPQRVYSL